LSVRQIVENVTSIVGQWRLEWCNITIKDTVYGPHFWTGRGFGLNLADAAGFWDGDHPDAPPLRSPHNADMKVLARAPAFQARCFGASSWACLER
jgi:hypothetical protein